MQAGSARSWRSATTTYDRLSRWYDLMAGRFEAPLRREGLRRLAAAAGETVVEIGPGTGSSLAAIADTVQPGGHVIGVELSRGMLQQSKTRLQTESSAEAVSLVRGDGRAIPVASGSTDAAFLSFTLELFAPDEASLVLGECRRILTPHGRLCVVALSDDPHGGWPLRLYSGLHRRRPSWIDCCPIDVAAAVERGGFDVRSADRRSLCGLPVAIVTAVSRVAAE